MSKTREDEQFNERMGIVNDLKSLEARVDDLLAAAKAGQPIGVAALKTQGGDEAEDPTKQAEKTDFWQN